MEDSTRRGTSAAGPTNGWLIGFALTWLVFYIAATIWAMYAFQGSWFSEAGPRSEPPWYFIGQDFFGAIGSAAVAIVTLSFTFFGLRRLGPMAWGLLAVCSLSLAGDIGDGVNIVLHTRQIWQESLARSQWPDFDSYNASRWTSCFVSLTIGVVIAAACLLRYKRAELESGDVR